MSLSFRLFVFASLCLTKLLAISPHLEERQNVPAPVAKYYLKDLGETTLDPSRLSKLHKSFSFAPSINNASQVIWNSTTGGTLKNLKPPFQEFAPVFDGMQVYFLGLNDNGDLLIAIDRKDHRFEWMFWPWTKGGYAERIHIATMEQFNPNVILSSLNNLRSIVGVFRCDHETKPAIWSCESGLLPLGVRRLGPSFSNIERVDAMGAAKAINNCGSVAGIYQSNAGSAPFIWNAELDFQVLHNFSTSLQPSGWHEFADIVIADDDTIFGTYWLRYGSTDDKPHGDNPYYGFVWCPSLGKLVDAGLEGMRLSAVNHCHLLVGSWQGRAAIKEPQRRPIFLDHLIDADSLKDWQLIEATDVNDSGQIVGFGTYQGKMHVFFVDRKEG